MKLSLSLVVLVGLIAATSAGPILNITMLSGFNLSQPFNLNLNPLASLLPHLNLTLFPTLNLTSLTSIQPLNLSLLNLGALPKINITLLPGLNLTALRFLNITAGSLISPLSLLPLFNFSAIPRLNFTGIHPAQLNLTLRPLLPRLNLTFPLLSMLNTSSLRPLNIAFPTLSLFRPGRSVSTQGSSEELEGQQSSSFSEAYTAIVQTTSGNAALVGKEVLSAITQAIDATDLSEDAELILNATADIPTSSVSFSSTNKPVIKEDKPTEDTSVPPGTNVGRRPASGRPRG